MSTGSALLGGIDSLLPKAGSPVPMTTPAGPIPHALSLMGWKARLARCRFDRLCHHHVRIGRAEPGRSLSGLLQPPGIDVGGELGSADPCCTWLLAQGLLGPTSRLVVRASHEMRGRSGPPPALHGWARSGLRASGAGRRGAAMRRDVRARPSEAAGRATRQRV
jgi:hypothetical protein